jgi:soluble lytic murein transglycosylase-like protein
MSIRLSAVFLVFVAASAADAGTLVQFEDGRSMHVEHVESTDGMVHLTLEGGGTIAMPASRVSGWSERAVGVAGRRVVAATEPTDEGLWQVAAGDYADLIRAAADRYDLDPALLTAMAEVESAFDPAAVSPKGASGILQLMPDTASRFGVQDVFDVEQNVDGGARYLSWLLDRFDGDSELAIAGYNAGEAAVDRYQGVPPYRETRRYVSRVLEGAGRLARLAP